MSKEELLRNFITKVWNQKRKDLVPQFVAKEYFIRLDPGDPWEGQILDHQIFIERLDFSFNSFPDINFEITYAIENENHVALSWILSGKNLGMIGEIPATKKKIKTNGISIYHFKEQLISGHSQVLDRNSVIKQLGF